MTDKQILKKTPTNKHAPMENKSIGKSPPPLYRFADRVLTVSLPTAGMLAILVFTKELSPETAVISFATVVMLTVVVMLPFLYDLQKVAEYTRLMSLGDETLPIPDIDENEEAGQIIASINQIRKFWNEKHEKLKAKSLSDAAVLDCLPDPLLMLGENRSIIGANLAARELFGANVVDNTLEIVLPDIEILEAVDAVLDGEVEREEIQFKIHDDEITYMRGKIELLPGQPTGGAVAVLALHDVTTLKRIEQLHADFVANASHELRTPLSIISGFIDTLKGAAKNDEKARNEFLDIMAGQSDRMSNLIEDLLTLSRIEMKTEKQPQKIIHIKGTLKNVTKALNITAKETGMNITLDIDANLPPVIGDDGELIQVFQNIIHNAIKYGYNGTEITVSAKLSSQTPKALLHQYMPPEPFVAVTVHNEGDTIPKEHLPRLIERFYRVYNDSEGTGLGLAIVKHIIRNHKGALNITSTKSRGTTFSVYLPIVPASNALPKYSKWGE
ncbi:MAG: two-component sensor histidine kinase [Alphaproteobacteria bacterium]|nr:two-component sensor histidine kinase [Alphaproteobacteria bacterium]